MAFTLDNRAKLRTAFYRLTGTSSTDDGLEEFDTETDEAVHYHLQQGLWEAQSWVLQVVDPYRWLKRSDAITAWLGTEDADGGRYIALPSDFLRLAGDWESSALRKADGKAWGALIEPHRRFDVRGDYYYLLNEQLWITPGATPPSTLYLHYHHRHPVLTDDTGTGAGGAIDFPLLDRPLIVGFAAQSYAAEASLPGGSEMVLKIEAYLERARRRAASRGRRTREPQHLRPPETLGTHFFV